MLVRRREPPFIRSKLVHIPFSDSLLDHSQDFKDILTSLDIPESEQSNTRLIASKAIGMDI
ncbi:hypothetical protein NC651_012759 [Populus alba x Populus x berolinensis]|nr:hypothetical protein NC651_012759 [Populus alba x Populus x berolinensis]